ncbi:hypothetical protein OCT63_19710 [Vibrio sp. RW]|uniref:hypothetical protein n=1 Tax=Vibrio sp. RW TaxID=2998833 RepID=UPI0022CD6ACE|nr:hypothetical protein [Vibrio sp. RW]MDA0146457.1 hypothetical protein [Vibrio sp. RW]
MRAIELANTQILMMYPNAQRITSAEQVSVGDVVMNHPKIPAIYVTKEILEHKKNQGDDWSLFFIIAKTTQESKFTLPVEGI